MNILEYQGQDALEQVPQRNLGMTVHNKDALFTMNLMSILNPHLKDVKACLKKIQSKSQLKRKLDMVCQVSNPSTQEAEAEELIQVHQSHNAFPTILEHRVKLSQKKIDRYVDGQADRMDRQINECTDG